MRRDANRESCYRRSLPLWCLPPALRANTLTPRALTERVARAVLAAMPSAKVAINGDLQFVVRYGNGASASSDFGRDHAYAGGESIF